MDEVAEEAGLGKGTLYRRFPDRASLCMALLDEETRELQEEAIAAFAAPSVKTHVERLIDFLAQLLDFTLDHQDLLDVAWSKSGPRSMFDHPAHTWQRTVVMTHLREGRRHGELRLPVSDAFFAETLLSGLEPSRLAWLLEHEGRDAVTMGYRALWTQLLGGGLRSPPFDQ